MNPFIFNPKAITTAQARNYVIGLYQREIDNATDIQVSVTDRLGAQLDLVKQGNVQPETIDGVIETATLLGQAVRSRYDLETTLREFVSALPYAVRLAK